APFSGKGRQSDFPVGVTLFLMSDFVRHELPPAKGCDFDTTKDIRCPPLKVSQCLSAPEHNKLNNVRPLTVSEIRSHQGSILFSHAALPPDYKDKPRQARALIQLVVDRKE